MAREEDLSFERITRVYREESQKKTLTPLESDFWDKVNHYLARLESDLAAARAKDPNSKGAVLLLDELQKVSQKREQIYQYRERKIASLAMARASGVAEEPRGLARQEMELLLRLTELLKATRSTTFVAPPPSAAAPPTPPAVTPDGSSAPPTPPPPMPPPSTGPRGVLLHILEDVPPFAGPEGTLRLRKEDIVSLPPTLAKVLLDRGKARVVQPTP